MCKGWTLIPKMDAGMLLRPGIIFFFELLQRIPPTFGPNQRLSYYRVGWSFIRPDLALREADKDGSPLSLKLQVFSYRRRLKIEKTPNRMTVKSVTDDEVPTQVPHVLYEYAWPCRVMQESRLSIYLELVDASQENAAASLTTQRKMSFDGKTLATEQAARETKLQECMNQKSDLTSEWPVPDELMHIFPTHVRGCAYPHRAHFSSPRAREQSQNTNFAYTSSTLGTCDAYLKGTVLWSTTCVGSQETTN